MPWSTRLIELKPTIGLETLRATQASATCRCKQSETEDAVILGVTCLGHRPTAFLRNLFDVLDNFGVGFTRFNDAIGGKRLVARSLLRIIRTGKYASSQRRVGDQSNAVILSVRDHLALLNTS